MENHFVFKSSPAYRLPHNEVLASFRVKCSLLLSEANPLCFVQLAPCLGVVEVPEHAFVNGLQNVAMLCCHFVSPTIAIRSMSAKCLMANLVSTTFGVFELLSWAFLTKSMTCDRNESLPVPLTSMVSEPSPLC